MLDPQLNPFMTTLCYMCNFAITQVKPPEYMILPHFDAKFTISTPRLPYFEPSAKLAAARFVTTRRVALASTRAAFLTYSLLYFEPAPKSWWPAGDTE